MNSKRRLKRAVGGGSGANAPAEIGNAPAGIYIIEPVFLIPGRTM